MRGQLAFTGRGNPLGFVNGGVDPFASATPYTGFVATRGLMGADQLASGFPQARVKSFHYARDDISTFQLVFLDSYGTTETGSGADTTISASVEYNGTRTRVTFGGSNDGVMPSGTILVSDEITLPETIPDGAKFFIHQFKRNPNGYIYSPYQTSKTAEGDRVQIAASGLVDDVMTADPVNNSLAIVAPAVIGTTIKPSVLILGDSKNVGVTDAEGGNAIGAAGETARSIGANYAYCNIAVAGERAYDPHTKRLPLAEYASHIISNHGINDVRVGNNLDSIKRYFAAMWTRFLGLDGQIVAPTGSVVDNTTFFFGLTEVPLGVDTLEYAVMDMAGASTFQLVLVNAANEVTFDEEYVGADGLNKVDLNLAVEAGDRLYYRRLSGGGLVYRGGGASHYFSASDYTGVLGDTVTQVSANPITLSIALRYASNTRQFLHLTSAPSEISGSPEATNGVRVEMNDWLRSTPPLLEAFVELANIVEDPDDSGIWVPAYTTDLIHENAAGYAAIEVSGVFPTLAR